MGNKFDNMRVIVNTSDRNIRIFRYDLHHLSDLYGNTSISHKIFELTNKTLYKSITPPLGQVIEKIVDTVR